jgi:nitroreductase
MDALELMRRRCSVRDFTDQPVTREDLLRVLEAARIAPSACNNQPWRFVVVDEPALKLRISERWGARAPVLIVACGDHGASWKRFDGKDHCDLDLAIAIDHMTLAAAELGLGTCWVCWFDAKAVAEVLGLPEGLEPVALLPLGHPKLLASPQRHGEQRKALEAIVSWNGFPA